MNRPLDCRISRKPALRYVFVFIKSSYLNSNLIFPLPSSIPFNNVFHANPFPFSWPVVESDVIKILENCIRDKENGLGEYNLNVDKDALEYMAMCSNGDVRTALNALELAVLTTDINEEGKIIVDRDIAMNCVQQKKAVYDKTDDSHYDVISAFIKSMRGSDPDATLHYLARMLDAGEDPMFIARRIVIQSSEDVGLVLCQACRQQLQPKIRVKTIWEYIDEDKDFIFPDYHHQKMYIQDCFRDKDHPEVHQAVRNLCKKMNIDLVEIKDNKENSTYCGTLHFTSSHPILEMHPDTKLSKLPEELQIQVMSDYCSQFSEDYPIIVDCNRCLRGIKMANKTGVHLLNLILN
mgnify:CR=1 FL=1